MSADLDGFVLGQLAIRLRALIQARDRGDPMVMAGELHLLSTAALECEAHVRAQTRAQDEFRAKAQQP